MTVSTEQAKEKLDILINKQRAVMYKPIQIAEILHHTRLGELAPDDLRYRLETYRNPSKRWRDVVTIEFVGRVSTSSQKYQDNLFEPNAIPPEVLAVLAEENNRCNGVVERYIYQHFRRRQSKILHLGQILDETTPDRFDLSAFLAKCVRTRGMTRSIGKVYEIVVYALFDTLVAHLRVTITLQADPKRMDLLREFERFAQLVLGIDCEHPSITVPANLYRAGVTNAADRGLDMWANFGPAIQVKHLNLTEDLAEEICDTIAADRIVIVCKDFEREQIERVCRQLGLSERIQGIITQNDLIEWYDTALRGKFAAELGADLLKSLLIEFQSEFPFSKTFSDFYGRRGYVSMHPSNSIFWQTDDD
jgi:hypothetical protein